MPRIKILQFSDLHMAADAAAGSLSLSDEARAEREREFLDMPRRICELARSEAVEMVLVPGDLFDCPSVAPDVANEVIENFNRLEVPIFILPGNHDPYSQASVWNRRVLELRSQAVWGANVFVFSAGSMQSIKHPVRDDVTVYGLGYREGVLPGNPFPLPRRLDPNQLNILLLHGNMDMFISDERYPALAFRAADVEAAGFDYAALGHYHQAKAVEEGRLIHAAFSGAGFGRGFDEEGPKSVIVGEVTRGGMRAASARHVQLDERSIRTVDVDVTGAATAAEVAARATRALDDAGATEKDIIRVKLVGRFPPQTRPRLGQSDLATRYFHFQTDARGVLPDYDLDEIEKEGESGTVEARFVARMRERIEKAPESRRALLRMALYLGLDAFRQEAVKPYAD